MLPIRRSPSQPLELADNHLDDLRVELRPVALRAPAAAIAGIASAVLLLLGLFVAAFLRLLLALLLFLLLALAPPFSTALL